MTTGNETGYVAPGEVIAGKYRIERMIGKGGMGVVVAATHIQLGQQVAIKLLATGATSESVARFLREARAAVRLKSEHVTRVLDVGQLPSGGPFMVMEYLDGSDLAQLVRGRGPLPISQAVEYVLHAIEAIAEAHALGIVHRDLKPANLFLTTTADGSTIAKVLDFGVSKEGYDSPGAGPRIELTRTTAMLGSPLYMAPEQMKSAKDVDARADIWSLGAILYELVTGQVPFKAESLPELVLAIHGDPPRSPTKLRPDVPTGLAAAILRCLDKDPTMRFGNVAELAYAISPFGPLGGQAFATRASKLLGLSSTATAMTTPLFESRVAGTAATRPLSTTVRSTGSKTAVRIVGILVAVVAIAAVIFTAIRLQSKPGLPTVAQAANISIPSITVPSSAETIPPPTVTPVVSETATKPSASVSARAGVPARTVAAPMQTHSTTPRPTPTPPLPTTADRNPLHVDIQ